MSLIKYIISRVESRKMNVIVLIANAVSILLRRVVESYVPIYIYIRIYMMCINIDTNDSKNRHKNNIIAWSTKALAINIYIYYNVLSRLHREKISVHQFNFVEIKKPCRKYRLFYIT